MMKTLLERYVVNDWKLKLLSLVLAIMLWYTVFQIGEPKKDITVPLTVSNLSRHMVITKMVPERVFVTVSGPVSMLKDIKERDVTAVISLNGVKEGETVFEISKANVALPKGIDIVDVKPGTVRVVIDRIIEKRLKVIPVLDKKWAGRYDIALAAPDHVVAEGPRKVLEEVMTVETLPVNGDLRRVEETVNVGFNTESLPRVRIRPDSARIVLRKHPGKEVRWD